MTFLRGTPPKNFGFPSRHPEHRAPRVAQGPRAAPAPREALALRVALQSQPPPVLFVSGGHNLGELLGPILWKPFLPTELIALVSCLIHEVLLRRTAAH